MLTSTIRGAAILAVGAWLMATGPAMAQNKTYTLKVANFTSIHSSSSRWFEATKKRLAKETGGRLNLEIFYGSSMGPMPRHYDLTRTGVSDMSFFQHGVTRGRFPLVELTHSPYLFPPGAKGALVGAKVAGDLLPVYFAKEYKGTKPLWIVFNRPSGVYDSKKPIKSLADLKGRRYRAPTSTDVAMLKELGALPIGMPATLMAESLQKGTIDGVVTDPMGVFAFKLGSLVKHHTPMFVSVISFGLAMNPKSYDRLPSDLKKKIDGLGTKQAGIDMATLSWGEDFPRYTKYMAGAKINAVNMSAKADAEMRAVAAKVVGRKIAAMEKKGLPAREVYAKLKALSAKYSKE